MPTHHLRRPREHAGDPLFAMTCRPPTSRENSSPPNRTCTRTPARVLEGDGRRPGVGDCIFVLAVHLGQQRSRPRTRSADAGNPCSLEAGAAPCASRTATSATATDRARPSEGGLYWFHPHAARLVGGPGLQRPLRPDVDRPLLGHGLHQVSRHRFYRRRRTGACRDQQRNARSCRRNTRRTARCRSDTWGSRHQVSKLTIVAASRVPANRVSPAPEPGDRSANDAFGDQVDARKTAAASWPERIAEARSPTARGSRRPGNAGRKQHPASGGSLPSLGRSIPHHGQAGQAEVLASRQHRR